MNPIAARMLRLGLPLAALVVAGGVLVEAVFERSERNLLESRQAAGLEVALTALRADLSEVASDLGVVSSFEEIQPVLEFEDAGARARLGRSFLTLARSRRVYARVRLLGVGGDDLVRVDSRQGREAVVPESELGEADARDRAFFSKALALPPGTVLVSPLALDVENGAVVEPLRPLLRLATPVTSGEGGKRGVVSLDYLAREVLEDLGSSSKAAAGSVVLVDHEGYFLRGRTPDDEWGRQISGRSDRKFGAVFPNAWRAIQKQEHGDLRTSGGSFVFRTVRPDSFVGDKSGREGGEVWKAVSLVPAVEVVAAQRRFLGVVAIGVLVLLFVIALAVYFVASQGARVEETGRRALEHLREAEERYRLLFERNQAGVFRSTPDGKLLECNEAFLRVVGLEREEAFVRQTSTFFADPEDRARIVQRLLTEAKAVSEEVLFKRLDGSTQWTHASLSLVRNADGSPNFIEGALIDVDERRRAVEALQSSETRTRALLENMLGGLIMVNGLGIMEFVNPAAERMFGYSSDELIGNPLAKLVPKRPGIDVDAFLNDALTKAMGRVTEWEGRRKNGDEFPFELALFQFETTEGHRIAGSIVDVTERREVDRLKREFVSSISHELRTPLTSIRGSLGLLAGGVLGPLSPDAAEIVAVAERNVVRLIGLINDILDLERLEGGRLEMEFSAVEATPIVTRALEAVQTFAGASGVVLAAEASSARVRADADRLVQVLVNLVSNAVKFSPAGGTVTVRVAPGAGMSEFQVEDHGRGVPPALREAIFERYRQVEASDSRSKGGAGLGLAICKSIVEQHGGTIGVRDTEGAGTGSTFWFRIPLASLPRPSFGGGVPSARGLALLVDDDEELLSILELHLAQDRVATQRATTAKDAIAMAFALKPDLLVLDLGLPDGDGSEVVSALRRDPTLRGIALLVYTGRDLRQEDRDRLVLGPTRFLTKSRETQDEFRSIVLELLASRKPVTT
jgi:PAS domain S-box-containing protein